MKFEDGFDVVQYIHDSFGKYENLLFEIKRKCDIVAFGGVPRDVLFFNKQGIRDIDLVVTNITNNDIINIFKNTEYRINRFGGLQLKINKIFIDIWSLNETWAFKNGYFIPTIENLPKSVFLNIDSIVVDLNSSQYYENGIFNAFSKRELDIIFDINPFPELCVLRSIIFRRKYDFSYSEKLKNYIYKFITSEEDPIMKLDKIQDSHYKEKRLSIDDIFSELREIIK